MTTEPQAPPRARGKVILFGEHAVVYGQPAIAAALELGVVAVGVEPAESLSVTFEGAAGPAATRADGTRLGEALDRLAGHLEASTSASCALALTLRSQIPIGAGLGSSAALAVAVARAILAGAPSPKEERLSLVLGAAEASESVFHGTPSGIDHTTSACGGVVRFCRADQPPFSHLEGLPPLPVVVAQMAPGADTGQMVAGVRALRQAHPALVDPLIAWMGQLAEAAVATLSAGDHEATGRLMDLAHGALCSLGVSTEALDRGCHAARQAGAWGAKLTGAGGGGCVVAIGPQGRREAIAEALRGAGASRVLPTRAGVG